MSDEVTISILVSYNQICVFDADMDEPFNDWTNTHVQQGFSWRPGSVSFGATENSDTLIEVSAPRKVDIDADAVRIIVVPFVVPSHGRVIIGSIGDEREVNIGAASYELWFELGKKNEKPWCRLNFIKNDAPSVRIIKADAEISKRDNFLMEARPA